MARYFNGTTNKWIIAPSQLSLTVTGLTVSCWVNPDAASAGGWAVFSGNQFNGSPADNFGLSLSSGKAAYNVYVGFADTATTTGTTVMQPGTWYHMAGANPSTGGATGAQIWVNGVLEGTGSMFSESHHNVNTPLRFGVQFDNAESTPGSPINAALAEVAIWNQQLTPMEILMLAAGVCPLAIRPQTLRGYWPLYGVLSPEPDWSGKNNWGTLGSASSGLSGVGPLYSDHPPQVQYPRSFLGPIEDQVWSTLVGGSPAAAAANPFYRVQRPPLVVKQPIYARR